MDGWIDVWKLDIQDVPVDSMWTDTWVVEQRIDGWLDINVWKHDG